MNIRDLIPYWLTAVNMLVWGLLLLWHAHGGRRILDIGAAARMLPRLLLALYYAFLYIIPDHLGSDVTHFMGRAAINMLALSDAAWLLAEIWVARKKRFKGCASKPWVKRIRAALGIDRLAEWWGKRKASRVRT